MVNLSNGAHPVNDVDFFLIGFLCTAFAIFVALGRRS